MPVETKEFTEEKDAFKPKLRINGLLNRKPKFRNFSGTPYRYNSPKPVSLPRDVASKDQKKRSTSLEKTFFEKIKQIKERGFQKTIGANFSAKKPPIKFFKKPDFDLRSRIKTEESKNHAKKSSFNVLASFPYFT